MTLFGIIIGLVICAALAVGYIVYKGLQDEEDYRD